MVVRRHRHRTEHIRGTVMLLHFSFHTADGRQYLHTIILFLTSDEFYLDPGVLRSEQPAPVWMGCKSMRRWHISS